MESRDQVAARIRANIKARQTEEAAERQRQREEESKLAFAMVVEVNKCFVLDPWDRGAGRERLKEVCVPPRVHPVDNWCSENVLDLVCAELRTNGHRYRIGTVADHRSGGYLYLTDPLLEPPSERTQM